MQRLIGLVLALLTVSAAALLYGSGTQAVAQDTHLVDRGRYLIRIAGCNDCHTHGYPESGGTIPEPQWLMGDTLGWRGPWGTTYAINLRLYMTGMTEPQWLSVARAVRSRPPMPWFALRDMTDEDLRAIYHFVRSLGPAGQPAPEYVPPGKTPKPPYVQFPEPPKSN